MRTVKRRSLTLNRRKFERIARIARAFADDKQRHLDFYQQASNFSIASHYRDRRNLLKAIDYHARTALPVHASDLAIKEAFETEVKYWAVISAEIHPGVSPRPWTNEQKHYAYWLLCDERRFAALIIDRAPINNRIRVSLTE